jgi:hypothetical protein
MRWNKKGKMIWDPFNLYVNPDGSPNRLMALFDPMVNADGSPNIFAQLQRVGVQGSHQMRLAAVPPDRPPAGMARFRLGPGQGCGRVDEVPEWQQPDVPAFGAWLDLGWVPAGYAWWGPRTPSSASSWDMAKELLRQGEDATAFDLEVVRRLRELETGDRDWPRADVERLHEEFSASVLSNTMIDCREAFVSPDQAKAALRSVTLPEEKTPLREILNLHEYALFRLAQPRILSVDMRQGVDQAVGRWDPYRPSEVLAALLQLIEYSVAAAADSLSTQD